MGCTPRIHQLGGRDHWARAMSIAFAGEGVPGGQTIGSTSKHGGVVDARYSPDGRPVNFTDGGRPIVALF